MLSLLHLRSLVVLLGHLSVWIWIYNRLHASGFPSRSVHRLEKWVIVSTLVTLGLVAARLVQLGPDCLSLRARESDPLMMTWGMLCGCMLAYVVVAWCVRVFAHRLPARLVSNHTVQLDVGRLLGYQPIGDRVTRMFAAIPGNQILTIHAQHKVLHLANLPRELDGLRIAQVTDLHMTGQLTRPFFDLAVDHTNQWQPDVVMITGDLVDDPACIAWLPDTLGRLQSRFGVYAILGNHDQRLVDVPQLRRALTDSGIEDLGGRCQVRAIRNIPVLLAGNECPWFPQHHRLSRFGSNLVRSRSCCHTHPIHSHGRARHGFNLMLAGHTHGGQIRIPLIGPIICPSRYGVWYASGLFERPPTLMHVSRGLSGVHPLRFWCPPELTLLELRCDSPPLATAT